MPVKPTSPRTADETKSNAGSFALSALAWTAVMFVPLTATWLAASLAAYGHHGQLGSALVGLLVFPLVPALWEGASTLRSGKKRWLRTRDRMVLRTLVTSLVFFAVLLALFPKTAFTALSTRGDFMFDGRQGAFADRGRAVAHSGAKGLE